MGHYVHLSVCYSSDLAERILPRLTELVSRFDKEDEDVPREARWFLKEILNPKNYNCGPKGELFTWGIVGNYVYEKEFVDYLSPFFEEQLRRELGPLDFDHIIVFAEHEQTEQAECFEIFLADGLEGTFTKGPLVVKHHLLPFCWNQM